MPSEPRPSDSLPVPRAARTPGLPLELLPGGPIDIDHVTVTGPERVAASAFDVDGLLVDTAAAAVGAVDELGRSLGVDTPARTLARDHLLAYCTTHCAVDGRPVPAWADLSGVYPTADGRHLQVHANFPHHADGVVRHLGVENDREALAAAIAQRDAVDLETELVGLGLIAAAVRTLDEWDAHPHAVATRGLPLVSVEQIGAESAPDEWCQAPCDHLHVGSDPEAGRTVPGTIRPVRPPDPLAGLRVLDCSRVLAGPVAGQLLAGFGADVLRVGAAHLPSIDVGVMTTGFGKRNTFVDLRTSRGRDEMTRLLAEADVWIDAYRPGALARYGFTPERVAELAPGIAVVQISAFDHVGPWAGRRGYDSIVQSTTGVRWTGGVQATDGDGSPRGLPVQALDYATGFLAAAAAARLVLHRRRHGGSWLARLSLLRTRNHLATRAEPSPFAPAPVPVDERFLGDVDSPFGRVTAVTPFAGRWTGPPLPLGTSTPTWLDDPTPSRNVVRS